MIIKAREESPRVKDSFDKENRNIAINSGGLSSRGYMDAISSNGPAVKLNQQVNEYFPLKKSSRQERMGQRTAWPSIQLF